MRLFLQESNNLSTEKYKSSLKESVIIPLKVLFVRFAPLRSVIGEFRIPGRPRTSACFCAKARLMRVTSHQENKQT